MMNLGNAERLREILDFNASTGEFIWRHRPASDFVDDRAFRIWNTRYEGSVAGCIKSDGYRRIRIDSIAYMAHRLAWLYVHGEEPSEEIDHINGQRSDNRFANLRAASRLENSKNTSICSHNTSGTMGVSYRAVHDRWRAYVKVNGKQIDLGEFKFKADAIAARKSAEPLYGYHANHGRAA
jgi:hypothetical protein